MEFNKETFEKALKANKIVRYQQHFEAVVKSYLEIENQALRQPPVSGSLLERVMLALDDYLNAGCKETRKQAAEKAKVLYKEYYGVDYVNRNDR